MYKKEKISKKAFYMENDLILIIEDERQIARFIELELLHEGYSVEVRYDGKEGLERIKENTPDLILLDLMLPQMSGFEICEKARLFSDVPIIMLTAKDEISDKVKGLDFGANDYITKPFVIEELLARIRVQLRKKGLTSKDTDILEIEDLSMDISSHEVKRGCDIIDLTRREYDLLEYMIKNKGIVLTRDQLLENVWGFDFMGDTNVVDVYIRYLRSKIDDSHSRKLIHTIRGVGYMLKEERSEN